MYFLLHLICNILYRSRNIINFLSVESRKSCHKILGIIVKKPELLLVLVLIYPTNKLMLAWCKFQQTMGCGPNPANHRL